MLRFISVTVLQLYVTELKTGTLLAMLEQLGLSRRDIEG